MAKGVKVPEAMADTVLRLISEGFGNEQIAYLTGVSTRQQQRIMKTWRETGSTVKAKPDEELRGRPRHLTTEEMLFLQGSVDNPNADSYLDELVEQIQYMTGKTVSHATIWRSLNRSGYTIKKITRNAMERNVLKRARYILRIGAFYFAFQLVFVDESSADRRTTYRNYAWAVRGARAFRKAFFIRGRRYSILPAITTKGILTVDIIEGSFNKVKFKRFIHGLLQQMNPWPQENSVIVMDNCRIHKCPEVLRMIEERGMKYVFLPPYSPDYNPIELAFSAIKAYIRRHGGIIREAMTAEDDLEVYLLLNEAVFSVTEAQAQSWYRHCGYIY